MYHHEIISRERIPYGAELFLHPAPNHDAFDAYVAKRLRRVCKLVGIQYCVPEDDSTLHGAMFSVLGQIASAIERKYGTISAVIYRAQDAEQERDTLREQVRVLKELMDKHNIGYEYRTALSAVKEQS
jgi:hypothetical protein